MPFSYTSARTYTRPCSLLPYSGTGAPPRTSSARATACARLPPSPRASRRSRALHAFALSLGSSTSPFISSTRPMKYATKASRTAVPNARPSCRSPSRSSRLCSSCSSRHAAYSRTTGCMEKRLLPASYSTSAASSSLYT
eukprot:scaffold6045_cov188-Prasinococcus_capsulatus_cf.AAC.1